MLSQTVPADLAMKPFKEMDVVVHTRSGGHITVMPWRSIPLCSLYLSVIVSNTRFDGEINPFSRITGTVCTGGKSFSVGQVRDGVFLNIRVEFIIVKGNDRRILWDSWQGNDGLQIDIIVFLDTVSMVRGLHYREDLIISARAVLNLDAKLMRRALENLFDNALRYSGPEASVFFTASVINDEIQISLQDEGQGIDARDLENIFKPFFRADNGRNSKGFGLGLTNVKSIIENHGGRIEVQSQFGAGTTVIVYLPLTAYK